MKAKQEDVVKERQRQLAVKGEAARLEVEEVNRRKAEKKKQKQVRADTGSSFFLFLPFPFCRGEAGHSSLCCTATFVFSIAPCCWPSLSTFLFSQVCLQTILPSQMGSFLQPSRFFISDLFGDLSSFILTMCPVHFIRLLTVSPTIPNLSSNFFSQVFHSPSLHSLYTIRLLLSFTGNLKLPNY